MGYFSNGTEGAIYEATYCERCVHYGMDENGDFPNGGCPVWMAHLLYAYELCNEEEHPGKIILDSLIPVGKDGLGYLTVNEECRMFVAASASASATGEEEA